MTKTDAFSNVVDGHETLAYINDKGKFQMYNKHLFDQYCADNKGKRLKMTLEVVDSDDKSKMMAYYMVEVVPKIKKGFFDKGNYCTDKGVKIELRERSPFKNLDSTQRMYLHIQWCIMFAAQEFNIIINDPMDHNNNK